MGGCPGYPCRSHNDRFHSVYFVWVNYGNVIFLEGGILVVIGLDTFDPAGGLALGKPQTDPKILYRLRSLNDSSSRSSFVSSAPSLSAEHLPAI